MDKYKVRFSYYLYPLCSFSFLENSFLPFFLDYVSEYIVYMYDCEPHTCSTHGGQQKALDPLGLEL